MTRVVVEVGDHRSRVMKRVDWNESIDDHRTPRMTVDDELGLMMDVRGFGDELDHRWWI